MAGKKAKKLRENGPPKPGLGELRKLDELRMDGIPEYPHLYEQALRIGLSPSQVQAREAQEITDIRDDIARERERYEDEGFGYDTNTGRQMLRDIKTGFGRGGIDYLKKGKRSVQIREPKYPEEENVRGRSWYRDSLTDPELVLNPESLRDTPHRVALVAAHELGHAYYQPDTYSEGRDGRTHKPGLMDSDFLAVPLVQKLIEQGYPREAALRAVVNELTHPDEDYGVLPPKGEKGAEIDRRYPGQNLQRPWAKKKEPYKNWDDWDARAEEFVKKRLPKKEDE